MSNLVIVESPAKAKTIEKYLGKDFRVVASIGHVRDLVPENGSVDTDKNFDMKWQIMPGKEKQIKIILDMVKTADNIYIASDPDREGEAIAWHILSILNDKKALKGKNVYRVAFHEITKNAVLSAIQNPREIDINMVDAYLVRRAIDYLIGFGISPLLWRKHLGRSAGRVQSVAVALVVDREREIELFNPVEYWSLDALCRNQESGIRNQFKARLTQFNGKKIEKMTIGDKTAMDDIVKTIAPNFNPGAPLNPTLDAAVVSLEKKKTSRRPAAPFTTSTLQQEAARKLHFSAKRTSAAAQKLYEAGHITYIRTDSTNLSTDAVGQIRDFIGDKYGGTFLPKSPNIYVTKSKNAQEAHEAIRPTYIDNRTVTLGADEDKLYDLVWKRTVACQMTNAEFDSVIADIKTDAADALFHAVGTIRTFDGFMTVYVEDNDDDEKSDGDAALPPLAVGDKIDISKLVPEQHFTMPPARYTDASLIKKLEELGIGRPSTYAAIMSTIVDRNYVELDKQRRFHPTDGGWVISGYLKKYFNTLMDVNFTAKTEDILDDVANGNMKRIPVLETFWSPTKKMIDLAKDIKTTEIIDELNNSMHAHLFKNCGDVCPQCGGKLGLKLSKYGPFIGCSNYPTCSYTMRLDTRSDGVIHEDDCPTSRPIDIDLGDGILFKNGRYGPYVTDGVKNASAKKYDGNTITIDIARELLSADKNQKADAEDLGENPDTKKPILYYATGRFGPYISSNKVNVSVKEKPTLRDAIDLINNKKSQPKKPWSKKKK